jgi:zinc/manganese transport system substrate-binding protein
MQRTSFLIIAVVIAIVVFSAFVGVYALSLPDSTTSSQCGPGSTGVIQVVAAENFWGSLVSQLGGTHVNVTSIVSDPNTDPHEYESNAADARLITNAQFIIVNGAGYDTWALNILSAENTPNQKVLNVQELIGQPVATNPHFWYSPYYVNDTVAAMYRDLICIDPANTAYFHEQYANLNASLWQTYMKEEVEIKQTFGGAPVASTESIFVYMANATGLKVVSPPGFMEAVAEGNDPSERDLTAMEQLMMDGNGTVHVLVYNLQTLTPITSAIEKLAAENEIPTIFVTETIQPPNTTFQVWMQGELNSLYNALNAQALGK